MVYVHFLLLCSRAFRIDLQTVIGVFLHILVQQFEQSISHTTL